jgi:hypothetical protein
LLAASAAATHIPVSAARGDQPPRTSVTLTEGLEGGLHGYISMRVPPPPAGFGYGISFYSTAWPLLASPLKSFQIGLPGTWITPDNRGFEEPLCPPGTEARDHWPERGPSYRDVFQTIEGGMGSWVSTQFASTIPKYRMNGTANCYSDEISSPGWGFENPAPLPSEKMGLVQLSNRLVVPPDGVTFTPGTDGQIFGTAWMALPLVDAGAAFHRQPTGDRSWTLFVNAANFKGPVAFWIPDTWSAIANGYPTSAGRSLDARPALMGGGAMEINTVPYFCNVDSHGVLYSRIPRLQFPVDSQKTSMLMQDVVMYSADALFSAMKSWSATGAEVSGAFNLKGAVVPSCTSEPVKFDQTLEGRKVVLTGVDAFLQTTMLGGAASCSYGLEWRQTPGIFPEYFKQDGEKQMRAVLPSEVPEETHLRGQVFAPAAPGEPFTSPATGSAWTTPGPKSQPFIITLTDGSRVTYAWYRFVDQPALQHLGLGDADKARLQALAEHIHATWPVTRDYMPPPSRGGLATLDSAQLVRPPRGLEIGYVPIVTRQELPRRQSAGAIRH